MTTFRFHGDFTFEAEDLDDAFEKLANHFRNLALAEDMDGDAMIQSGELHIARKDDNGYWLVLS